MKIGDRVLYRDAQKYELRSEVVAIEKKEIRVLEERESGSRALFWLPANRCQVMEKEQ